MPRSQIPLWFYLYSSFFTWFLSLKLLSKPLLPSWSSRTWIQVAEPTFWTCKAASPSLQSMLASRDTGENKHLSALAGSPIRRISSNSMLEARKRIPSTWTTTRQDRIPWSTVTCRNSKHNHQLHCRTVTIRTPPQHIGGAPKPKTINSRIFEIFDIDTIGNPGEVPFSFPHQLSESRHSSGFRKIYWTPLIGLQMQLCMLSAGPLLHCSAESQSISNAMQRTEYQAGNQPVSDSIWDQRLCTGCHPAYLSAPNVIHCLAPSWYFTETVFRDNHCFHRLHFLTGLCHTVSICFIAHPSVELHCIWIRLVAMGGKHVARLMQEE